jgi:4-amino-4-deoxy-L-arabinose transferase-like glycosyltransferase
LCPVTNRLGCRIVNGARVWGLVVVLAAAAAMYWPAVDGVPFYTKGEPREAIVVQQMLAEREFILPLRSRGEIPSKPPLFHWLGAIASTTVGSVSETTTRLPSLLASLATIALTMVCGFRLYGTAAGLGAGVMLATSQQWLQSSTAARVDMVLAAAIAASLLTFCIAYLNERSTPPLLCYGAAALAVLTKGPVGYALPGLVVTAFLAARRDWRYLAACLPRPALLILCLPLVWYALAWWLGGQAFIDKLILKENVYRVLDPDAVGAGHVEPFYFYASALLGGMAPWSVLLPLVAVELWRRRARVGVDGSSFLICWFVVTLVVFSLAGSKRSVYLLSCYPALALLAGSWLSRRVGTGLDSRPVSRGAVIASSLVAVVVMLAALLVGAQAVGLPAFSAFAPWLNPKDAANVAALADALRERVTLVATWLVGLLLLVTLLIRSAARGAWGSAFVSAAVAIALTAATVGAVFLRDMAERATLKPFMTAARERVPADEPLSFYGNLKYLEYFEPAAVYYAERAIAVIDSLDELENGTHAWLLVGASSLGLLQAEAKQARRRHDHRSRWRPLVRDRYPGSPGREPILLVEMRSKGRRRPDDHVE